MLVVGNKTIAFTSDGTLIIFDNREEFATWADGKEDYEVWAEPKWLLYTLRELEKEVEEKGGEGEIITELDSLPQWIKEGREAERGQVGEKWLVAESENAVRAIKARGDGKQRKWGVGG